MQKHFISLSRPVFLALSRHHKTVLTALVAASITSAASADMLFYDSFEYPDGSLLAPENDTTGSPNPGLHNVAYNVDWRYAGGGLANQNAPHVINSGGSDNLAGLGGSAKFDFTQLGSARIQVSPTAINSGTVYWSATIRVDSIESTLSSTNGAMLGGFNNTVGPGGLPTAVGAVLRIRKDPTNTSLFDIGTAMNSGTGAGNIQWSSGFAPSGNTIFLVAAYNFVSGSSNDTAQMWINPSSLGAVSAPAADLTSAPGLADSFTSLSTYNLRDVNTVGSASVEFDDLRVGTSWESVTSGFVPEPATLVLLALGTIGLVPRRRSRRS